MLRLHLYLNVSETELQTKGKKSTVLSKDRICFLRQPLKEIGSSGCHECYQVAEEPVGNLPFSVHPFGMFVFWDV